MKNRTILIWTVLAVIIVGAVSGIFVLSKNANQGANISGAIPAVSSTDWTQGNPNAKAVLVEYADFQCPACAEYNPILQQLISQMGNQMLFVYRYFPLESIHPNAALSAQAAEAAGMQGKFWQMHDLLFSKQTEWETSTNASQLFTGYAQDLGLNTNKFQSDMNSQPVKDKIANDYQTALQMSLSFTPTFFLNGKLIDPNSAPQSVSDFKTLIQNTINAAPTP